MLYICVSEEGWDGESVVTGRSVKHRDKSKWCVERVPVHCLVTLFEGKRSRCLPSCF
jgi:hypothetical protein